MSNVITSKNFTKSLEIALDGDFDCDAAIKRLQGIIDNMPASVINMKIKKNVPEFYEHESGSKKQKYLCKSDSRIYLLARKRYCESLLNVLKEKNALNDMESHSQIFTLNKHFKLSLKRLTKLVENFDRGNLDLARIVMTSEQYKWYTRAQSGKSVEGYDGVLHETSRGITVRSKSERDIGNACEKLCAFYRYEDRLTVNVSKLVSALGEKLRDYIGEKHLFYPTAHGCDWTVPPELAWMNAKGSVWRSFKQNPGTILVHPDFTFMLADGSKVLWEHEGLFDDFTYRCNSTERAAIYLYTETVARDNLIETFESEVDDEEKIQAIIASRILPRLWF